MKQGGSNSDPGTAGASDVAQGTLPPTRQEPAPDLVWPDVPPDQNEDRSEHRQQWIARRAYALAESRGFAPGGQRGDWIRAEHEHAVQTGRHAPGLRSFGLEPSPQIDHRLWVAERAYELAEQRGFAQGHDLDDWRKAEHEFEARFGKPHRPAHPDLLRLFEPHTRVYDVSLEPVMQSQHSLAAKDSISTLSLRDAPEHGAQELFVERQPIGRRNWRLDPASNTLTFAHGAGAERLEGSLKLARDGRGYGLLMLGATAYNASIQLRPVTYDLELAPGAAYVSGTTYKQLNFDAGSEVWRQADWTPDVMRVRFHVAKGPMVAGQDTHVITFQFEDLLTGESWQPLDSTYAADVDEMRRLRFKLLSGPPRDHTGRPFRSPRFPWMLVLELGASAQDGQGAMLCGHPDETGTAFGIRARYDGKSLHGLYALTPVGMPAGAEQQIAHVHDGRMWIDGEAVPSRVRGNLLTWQALPDHIRARTGLPESGRLRVSAHGDVSGDVPVRGNRVTPDDAAHLVSSARHLHHVRTLMLLGSVHTEPAKAALNPQTLLNMTQWEIVGQEQRYVDVVQQAAMEDFYNIVQHNTPSDLAARFYSSLAPLDARLGSIARMPGPSGADPKAFYEDLSIAYLAAALPKSSSDEGAKHLNARRAEAWLRSKTSASEVFQAHSTRLYGDRYIAKNAAIADFLLDQKNNARKWSSVIDEDLDRWKAEMREMLTESHESIDTVMAELDKIGAAGKEGRYWAYFVFRYTTNERFLFELQLSSIAPQGIEGSECMRTVQRVSAILQVLDPSSFFTQQFAYVLQLFQVGNVLPQLFDMSEAPEDYRLAVTEVFDAFMKKHIDSADETLRAAAQELAILRQRNKVGDLMAALQQASVTAPGLFSWECVAARFESGIAKFMGHVPRFLQRVGMLAAVGIGIYFFASGEIRWSSLSTMQRAGIAGSVSTMVAMGAVRIARQAIAIANVFERGIGFWKGLWGIFSCETLTKAQNQLLTGFRGWLIGGQKSMDSMLAAARGAAGQAAVAGERAAVGYSGVTRIFGRNFNEFMATRVGAFLAAAALITSIVFAVRAGDPLERTANILFAVASFIDLCAAVGGWAVSASVAVAGSCVASVLPVLGPLAIVVAIAGIVLMLVEMFKPRPSVAEQFATQQARSKGFYMPFGAEIEDLEFYQPLGQPQRSGVAFFDGTDPDNARAVRLSTSGTADLGPQDHTAATSMYLHVDESGEVQILAPLDSAGVATPRALAVDAQGKVIAAPVASTADARQRWRAEMLAAPTREGSAVAAASLALVSVGATDDAKYLVPDGAGLRLGKSRHAWTARMITTMPAGLHVRDLVLTTLTRDAGSKAMLAMPGSAPLSWKVTPDLPPGFEFDPHKATVAQKPGIASPVLPRSAYTLCVSNPVGATSAPFHIEVLRATP